MRALLTAGALSLAFTLFLTPLFIRLFTRLGWGQFIRDDGPKSHHVKRGTPTMGGIIFILGTLFGYFVATLLVSNEPPTAAATKRPVMIQNRTTIVTSAQPLSSKWWCSGVMRNTRLPPVALK